MVIKQACALGVFILAQLCLARTARHSGQVPLFQADGPLASCPDGYRLGFEAIAWQLTGMPSSEFLNKTGSFLDSEWYVGPINSTVGDDNTVGAKRISVDPEYPDLPIIETMTGYYTSPTEWVHRFVLEGGPVVIEKVEFSDYDEEFRAQSICGGEATYLSMTAAYCSTHVVDAYSLFDKYRRRVIMNLEDEWGVQVFDGTCPNAWA